MLPESLQFEQLRKKAVLLADYTKERYTYVLYQLEGFYIEVRYNTMNNEVIGIRSFKNTELLDPYLTAIRIELF